MHCKLVVLRALGLLVCLLTVRAARADLLPIVNPGFEDYKLEPLQFTTPFSIFHPLEIVTDDPIPGWVVSLDGAVGTFRPTSPLVFAKDPPEGRNTAYIGTATPGSGFITQVLPDTLAAGTFYTLAVDVGKRLDFSPLAEYSVQLLAGGVVLNEGSTIKIPKGGFTTVYVFYYAKPDDPLLGQNLKIRFVANYNFSQVNFDNVWLDATPFP